MRNVPAHHREGRRRRIFTNPSTTDPSPTCVTRQFAQCQQWFIAIVICSVGFCGIATHSHAQQLVGDLTLPNPTNVQTVGNDFQISGGTRPNNGPNLFHRFFIFNVPENARALFLPDGHATTNIIGRVTAAQPSSIEGTIDLFTRGHGFVMTPDLFDQGTTLPAKTQASLNLHPRRPDTLKAHTAKESLDSIKSACTHTEIVLHDCVAVLTHVSGDRSGHRHVQYIVTRTQK